MCDFKGCKLGIYEDTRMEWTVGAFGCLSQSITVLTVYSNLGIINLIFLLNFLGENALIHALHQAEVTHIFTNGSLLETVFSSICLIPDIEKYRGTSSSLCYYLS